LQEPCLEQHTRQDLLERMVRAAGARLPRESDLSLNTRRGWMTQGAGSLSDLLKIPWRKSV